MFVLSSCMSHLHHSRPTFGPLALRGDGTVVTWGALSSLGSSSSGWVARLRGVQQIAATQKAFAAVSGSPGGMDGPREREIYLLYV